MALFHGLPFHLHRLLSLGDGSLLHFCMGQISTLDEVEVRVAVCIGTKEGRCENAWG